MISHHADGTMSIRLIISVKVADCQFFSFFFQALSYGFLNAVKHAV